MIQKVTQRLKFPTACLLLVLGAFVSSSSAEETGDLTSQPFSPAPYCVGERLTYNVSFQPLLVPLTWSFWLRLVALSLGREGIQLKGHVETDGVANVAPWGLKTTSPTLYPGNWFALSRLSKIIRETARTTETSAEFNQPAGTAAIPDRRSASVPGTYDFLSAIYRLRALSLADGATYSRPFTTKTKTIKSTKVNGREVI